MWESRIGDLCMCHYGGYAGSSLSSIVPIKSKSLEILICLLLSIKEILLANIFTMNNIGRPLI